MSNVVALNVSNPRKTKSERLAAMIASFASQRRYGDDVFWLKENAELLNILECTVGTVDPAILQPHSGFYAEIERRLGFFPQYYRFLLSICLDLEDLGLAGQKGEALAAWVAKEGLAEAELSDLQRAEARRLMARRGIDPLPDDVGLTARLHRFIDRSETFAMPNKKAAYELTHIVFYLSEYGRTDPNLSPAAFVSLEYAGILAYLDQNADLLAEICVALRYAGATPPRAWEMWLERETHRYHMQCGPQVSVQDDYHEFFVCNWMLACAGRDNFLKDTQGDRVSLERTTVYPGPLRHMSECMFRLADDRSGDWHRMRPQLIEDLDEISYDILVEAEESSARFGDFFEGFARTGLRGVAL
ncbi:MAG: hypothetical protein AAFR45_08120 [Pseudomonadota bacterium]